MMHNHKPLPTITDQTQPFWTAANAGRLVIQQCQRCATWNFPPKPWCIACGSRDVRWIDVRPSGTVYAYTISRSVAMNYPGWQAELPILMCLIDMDDGLRMYGQVTDCVPETMRVGLRVRAYFESISAQASIPKFRLEN